jgi:polysaccharide export outer membrane protein
MNKTLLCLFTLVLLTGCATREDVAYLQNTTGQETVAVDYDVTVKPGDLLRIAVVNRDMRTVQDFNPSIPQSPEMDQLDMNNRQRMLGYLVDPDGFIQFPVLGNVKVGGKNKNELVQFFQSEISKFVKDPIVDIRILNYRITVLGEVNNPGTYTIQEERVNLLQAIGLAGDLTIFGKRQNVLLIRDVDGVQKTYRIDLRDASLLSSDLYYLKQNDVLVVEPTAAQIRSSGLDRSLPLIVSITSGIIVPLVIILTRN